MNDTTFLIVEQKVLFVPVIVIILINVLVFKKNTSLNGFPSIAWLKHRKEIVVKLNTGREKKKNFNFL